ncbi:hypothetical protein PORY_002824 [Pneumocystis oryctolagi]|uniref:Uncharacterized protein n=1 Tax=Pneumocystis oryctolagi TaxID=42067 RepID=A0ACB7C9Q6_9ASCO|nr:hypothetical protein PORY_002824 [Pneumocystis oryctolagi]
MFSDNVYNVSSKVVAVVTSPWIVILIALVFICSLYVFYYRPRLYYPYPSYPLSPTIYFLPPWKRIRDFNRNPIQYLLTAISRTSHPSMIWIDVVKPYTCLSIILRLESYAENQFLLTDESVLSWDAALRQNWCHIFKNSKSIRNMDNFGRSSRFSKASNLCLSRAFSFSRTNIGGYYYSCIASEARVALSQNTSDSIDLRNFINNIVIRALLSIFFGSYESDYEHILRLTNTIHKSLGKSHSYDSNALKAKNEFVKVISKILIKRSSDPETYSNGFDYVQWLLTHGLNSELSVGSMVYRDKILGSSGNNGSVNAGNEQKSKNFSKILEVDIPVHLLVSVLSTWIICTNAILWVIVNQYRISEKEIPFDPNPLFLVRRARKDILIGKFLVPKNTYLSICSSVSSLSSFFMSKFVSSQISVNSSGNNLRNQSLDELRTKTSINHSQGNISFFLKKNNDSIAESSSSSTNCHRSQETIISNSMSESSLSTLDIGYTALPLDQHNFSNGIRDRTYPHQHLIRLIITTVLNHIASAVVINKIASEKLNVFYTARHLWFPIPSQPIFVSILPSTFIRSNIDQK